MWSKILSPHLSQANWKGKLILSCKALHNITSGKYSSCTFYISLTRFNFTSHLFFTISFCKSSSASMIFSISNFRSLAWNYPWISFGKDFVEQTLVHICVFLASTHLNISIQKMWGKFEMVWVIILRTTRMFLNIILGLFMVWIYFFNLGIY